MVVRLSRKRARAIGLTLIVDGWPGAKDGLCNLKLGSKVKILTACRDNLGANHQPGEEARVVAFNSTKVQVEFWDRCVFKRGRITLALKQVEIPG
jgi:hypothetical protein